MPTFQGGVVEFAIFEPQLYGIMKSDNRKPQHWKVAERAASERRKVLTAKTRRLLGLFCLHLISLTFSNKPNRH